MTRAALRKHDGAGMSNGAVAREKIRMYVETVMKDKVWFEVCVQRVTFGKASRERDRRFNARKEGRGSRYAAWFEPGLRSHQEW